MKKIILPIVFLALTLIFISVGSAWPKQGTCPIQSNTNVVIYGDTGFGGVGIPSLSWQKHFFDWLASYNPGLHYVILDKNDVKTDCNLASFPNVKLYVQPGGNAYYQQNSLGNAGKQNILNYLNNGGAYFGACAGAYYAAGDYYWQGSYYNWADLLGRFPTFEGSITTIADFDSNPGYAMTGIDASGKGFNMIYYGGPTRGWRDTPISSPGQQILTFRSIPGNLPAAFVNGKMLLTSIHAEAYENDGITGLATEDRIENYKWLANSINEVSGMGLYVPAYSSPSQCSDNIDNDGDSFVDYPADAGCSNLNDNDETDPQPPAPKQCADGIDNDLDGLTDYPSDVGCANIDDDDETDVLGPVTLFSDDFESGTLGAWTLSKASGANDWVSATGNPYQGTRYAESKPQSTIEPASTMEKAVSTIGYNTITFSYARKLVGLDVADEFKAKWFDGSSWNVLEQTGSGSANDAGYLARSFTLASSAGNNANFKIRFECTAGAVSEFCRVDNVIIVAN